jgi:hypothetical protein
MKIKIGLMIVGLIVLLFAMNYLRNGKPVPGLADLNGPATEINWCKSRVKSIVNKDEKINVEQLETAEWVIKEPAMKSLSPVWMEKWLGEHCRVKVDSYLDRYVLPGGQSETVFTFIGGEETRFVKTEPETFLHQGSAFKSRQLDQAFKDLFELARSNSQP